MYADLISCQPYKLISIGTLEITLERSGSAKAAVFTQEIYAALRGSIEVRVGRLTPGDAVAL